MKEAIRGVLFFVIGLWLGLTFDVSSFHVGMALVGLVIGYPLGIFIHELGHLVCGALTGYRFISFRVFQWILYKQNGLMKWGKLQIVGTLGQCLMDPKNHQHFVLYHLGGILFNLMVFVLCLLSHHDVLLGIGIINLLMAILNAFPAPGTDGSNVWDLLFHPKDRPYFFNQMHITALQTQHVRLKDMPRAYFSFHTEDLDLVFGNASAVMCTHLWMDLNEYTKAETLIDELLSHPRTHPMYKHFLICDKIYLNIRNGRREDNDTYLNPSFEKFLKAMKNDPVCLRTQYLLGRIDVQTMKERLLQYPYQGDVDHELELLEELNDGTIDYCRG